MGETSKPRVPRYLFVNENIGGHRTVHANLAAAFSERDDVLVDFLDVPPATGGRRVVSAAIPGLRRWDLDLQALRAQLAQSQWVRRRLDLMAAEYDALHLYTQNVALRSATVMRAVPSVITTDSTNVLNAERIPGRNPSRFTPRAAALGQRWERPVLAAAAQVVANSEFAATSLREDYHVPADRLQVMPFGISIPAPLVRVPHEKPRLVFIGTTLERKGGAALMRVHRADLADRCDLVLVTTEPVPAASGVTVVDDLVPGDPRLWDILAAADVFVFPSAIDQAPNVVLEAMAAGLPVVACGVGAVPEMVVDGQTGLLVPPGDDAALRAAVSTLLDDPDRARAMGARGRERAVGRYDIRRNVEELLELMARARRGGQRDGARPPER